MRQERGEREKEREREREREREKEGEKERERREEGERGIKRWGRGDSKTHMHCTSHIRHN